MLFRILPSHADECTDVVVRHLASPFLGLLRWTIVLMVTSQVVALAFVLHAIVHSYNPSASTELAIGHFVLNLGLYMTAALVMPVAAGWRAGGLLLHHRAVLELQLIPFGLSVLTVEWLPNLRRAISRVQLLLLVSSMLFAVVIYVAACAILQVAVSESALLSLAVLSAVALFVDSTISRATLNHQRGLFSSVLRGRFYLGTGLLLERWRKPIREFAVSFIALLVIGLILLFSITAYFPIFVIPVLFLWVLWVIRIFAFGDESEAELLDLALRRAVGDDEVPELMLQPVQKSA